MFNNILFAFLGFFEHFFQNWLQFVSIRAKAVIGKMNAIHRAFFVFCGQSFRGHVVEIARIFSLQTFVVFAERLINLYFIIIAHKVIKRQLYIVK